MASDEQRTVSHSNEIGRSLGQTWRSLGALISKVHEIAPFAGCFVLLVGLGVTAGLVLSPVTIVGAVLVVFIILSLIIYAKTGDWGQASFSFAVGILAAFDIPWTRAAFWAFSSAVLVYVAMTFIVSSVKLAARLESVLRQAALFIAPFDHSSVEEQMKEIAKRHEGGVMGIMERAECVRRFAYAKMPLDAIGPAVDAVDMLATITDVPAARIAAFTIDMYAVMQPNSAEQFQRLTDLAYSRIKALPLGPEEFFELFAKTRHVLLREHLSFGDYLTTLGRYVEDGMSIADAGHLIDEYLPRE